MVGELAHSVLADCAFKCWAPPSPVKSLFPYPLNITCRLYPINAGFIRARRFFCSSLVHSRAVISTHTHSALSSVSRRRRRESRRRNAASSLTDSSQRTVSVLSSSDEVPLLVTVKQPHKVPCCLPALDVPGMIFWLFHPLNTKVTLAPPAPLC